MDKNHSNGGYDNRQTTAAEAAVLSTEEKLLHTANLAAGETAANKELYGSREEGELSSDVDEFVGTGSPSQDACGLTTQMEPVQASSVNDTIQDTKAGQRGPDIKSADMVGVSGASRHEENVKNSEKNREPFVPFVIRFSDDESGSDSDDGKQTNHLTEVHKQGADGISRQPTSSLLGSQKSQQDMRKKAGPMVPRHDRPPVASNGRPHVSALTKINGSAQWNAGQKPSVRNFSNLRGRAVQNQIPVLKTTLNSSLQELLDLRKLVAIQESKVQVKATQQTKNSVGGSSRDGKVRSPDYHVDRVRRSSDFDLRSELGESAQKRLKTGELQSSDLASDLEKTLPQPALASRKSSLMNYHRDDVADTTGHCDKSLSLPSSGQVGRQVVKQGTLSANILGAEEGNGVVGSISQRARNDEGLDSVSLLRHTGKAESGAVGDFPKKSYNMELNPSNDKSQELQTSIPDMVTSSANLPVTCDNDPVKLSNVVSKLRSEVRAPTSPLHILNANLQEALCNPSFFNDLNKINLMENNDTDLRSLLDFEELLDKEVDEAQEHRRKCEVEEKNALMAYRKAQRVLVEAHARCSQLYSKRELYSAQLRSFMMKNPNLFSSQKYHDQKEAGFKSSNSASDVNIQLKPSSCPQVLTGSGVNNKCSNDANIPSANNEFQNLSDLCANGQNLVSNPCLEPDGSPLKVCKPPVSDGVCSPSGDLSRSSFEEGEIFELNHKSAQENIVSQGISEMDVGREKDIYEESERQGPCDSSQDCLLLEASLRAQLFEKFKAKRLSKPAAAVDHLAASRAENDNAGKVTRTDSENTLACEAENDKHSNLEDDNLEERLPELPTQFNCQFDISSSSHESPTEVPIHGHTSLDVEQATTSGNFFFPAVKSAFNHLKVKPLGVPQCKSTNPEVLTSTGDGQIEDGGAVNRNKPSIWSLDANESTSMDLFVGQSGCFSSDLAVDPVWPLCMYELRGKCNNDECSWQHVRDYTCSSMKPEGSDNSDTQFMKQSGKEQLSSAEPIKKSLDNLVLAPPIYVVGLDILKPDSHLRAAAPPQGYGQCWQRSFSSFLVFSSLCPTVLQPNEPFLHGTEARIEVHNSLDRLLSYFQSRNGTPSQLDQCTSGVEQSVEMALLNLKEKADKNKFEAVKLLARAIEEDPTSAVLWIVYLLIFYSNQKSVGEDDLFQYAVSYSKGSYELWLLYINSRIQLVDRLAAYDSALLDLCHHASKSDDDALHASQCILDIFLQMIYCLCMSGNAGRAIEKISGLFLPTKKSEGHPQLSLSNIVTCLTVSDKFIFWMCGAYLIVYKTLPDHLVQRFECWKESSAIEWPSVCLRSDEKQLATSLLGSAVDSLESYLNHESLENEKTLRAAHLFALNHVRCISVLEGLDCGRNLLEKYIKLYPSCLELVLMSARAEYELGGSSLDGFEEALRNWPNEDGVQCIWNQYAGFALHNGNVDFVKVLMDRWLYSVLETRESEKGVLGAGEQNSDRSLKFASAADLHAWFCSSSQGDTVFGMLNFSLYKLLQNDWTEARLASELALKASTRDNYLLCLKEVVPFWLSDSIQHEVDIHLKGLMNIMNVHLVDTQALLVSEQLSRAFIQKFKKPRVQQLVSKLLSPVSAELSLMMMVLEVWHGLTTMFPNVFAKPADLVDFAEAMMEILPSNYLLGISVCRELRKIANSCNFSAGLSFWGGSFLVNAFYHAVPVAPEHAWVEAAELLHSMTDIQCIKENFHTKALSVHPFSKKLWESYLHVSDTERHVELVKESAKKKGIEF